MKPRSLDRRMLELAARCAWRARGVAEPNPTVGCVIGVEDGSGGAEILALGRTGAPGRPHAEADALARAQANGADLRAATLWTTLEPCAHTGRTPPCVDAILAAGVARVVAARLDPHDIAAGGIERLRADGVRTDVCADSRAAVEASDPFIKRIVTGMPWVVAKWAQSIDGRVATRAGVSKWISSAPSRRIVHRLRGRVDAVLTGIGTVVADDPLLTVRGVRARRTPARAVIDPSAETPLHSALVRTAHEVPTICFCAAAVAGSPQAGALRDEGVEVIGCAAPGGELDLVEALRVLGSRGMTNVLFEAGPRLLGRLVRHDLIDEAIVFVAPYVFADELALPAATGVVSPRLAEALRLELRRVRSVGGDALLALRRPIQVQSESS